jgi:hypothetical protein
MKRLLLTSACLLSAACGAETAPTDLNAVPTSLPSTKADDYAAQYCEVFVDAAQIFTGDEGEFGTRMFVKTINSRLDGNITGVGFYGQLIFHGYDDDSANTNVQYQAFKATSAFGASDYFSVDLAESTDAGETYYVGAFYVVTDKGTTYWANAKSYAGAWDGVSGNLVPQHPTQNFLIDANFADAVNKQSSSNKASILGFTSSDNQGAYFNPNGCK